LVPNALLEGQRIICHTTTIAEHPSDFLDPFLDLGPLFAGLRPTYSSPFGRQTPQLNPRLLGETVPPIFKAELPIIQGFGKRAHGHLNSEIAEKLDF
jgi:hypothetical protein